MITLHGYENIQQIKSGTGFIRFAGQHAASAQPVELIFFPLSPSILSEAAGIGDVYDALAEIQSDHIIAVHAVKKIIDGAETVETHRQQIMKKLDAKSVAELTKIAVREGLAALE